MVEKKLQEKKQLSALKNNYLTIIYGGLIHKDSIRSIHKRLYDETINQKKLGQTTSDLMLKTAYESTKVLKRKSEAISIKQVKTKYGSVVSECTPEELLSIAVFDLLHKSQVEKRLSHDIVKQTDKSEGDSKYEIIDAEVNKNRLKNKIFYLASYHKDSANDHKNWQGKIYIDEKWESLDIDYGLRNAIKEYIRQHDIKTFQWVIFRPVWLVTRPNCRHYFKSLTIGEVLKTSATNLRKKYNMDIAIGNREYLQTINHSTRKSWYEDVRNAQLILKQYKERLALHQKMYKEMANPIIKTAIEKDKLLINRWQNYLNQKEKGII